MSQIYDVAVIGAGMFGSAAAKYLGQEGARVALIGPAEPPDKQTAQTQKAFGAHYDEARISRRIGWDDVWWEIDTQSLKRFHQIEDASGIPFFHEQGSLVLTAKSMARRTEKILKKCAADDIPLEHLSEQDLAKELPYFSCPVLEGGTEGLYERWMAGYLNPRKMVDAQLTIAQKYDVHLHRSTLIGIKKDRHNLPWRLDIEQGTAGAQINAQKVLVTTGAFTNHNNILPADYTLQMNIYTEPNLLFEITHKDAKRLRNMPAILISDPNSIGHKNLSSYLLPPITYPDGKTYIRIGPGAQPIIEELFSLEEMCQWYIKQEITPEQYKFLFNMMVTLLPDIRPVSIRQSSCIIEKTPTHHPYIGQVSDDSSYHVAIGGNGRGARGSDEIGRIAAQLILNNKWDSSIPQDAFYPRIMERKK